MTRKRIVFRLLICAALFFFLTLAILLVFNNRILSKNHPIDADELVIEGWLPAYILEQIPQKMDLSRYKTIFVTGIAYKHPPIDERQYELTSIPAVLSGNGCLGLTKATLEKIKPTSSLNEISLFVYGSKALNKFAHFFVVAGDSIIGQAFVSDQPQKYVFRTGLSLTRTKGIFVYYNNDLRTSTEDRNLIVDSISINGKVFNKPSDFFKLYDSKVDINLFSNYPFQSKATVTAAYLKALGINNKIITIDTFYNKRNRTLVAAKRFNSYINRYSKDVSAFNIISVPKHSRRSYLSYKVATFGRKEVGIISLNYMAFNRKTRTKEWLRYITLEYAKIFIMTIQYLLS